MNRFQSFSLIKSIGDSRQITSLDGALRWAIWLQDFLGFAQLTQTLPFTNQNKVVDPTGPLTAPPFCLIQLMAELSAATITLGQGALIGAAVSSTFAMLVLVVRAIQALAMLVKLVRQIIMSQKTNIFCT